MQTQQEEIWKDIKQLEGLYQISNLGRVKSLPRVINSPVQKCGFRISKEKIKSLQNNGKGYYQLYVQVNNKRKLFYIHRLVAKYFIPNPENKPEVNHINGIKTDNRVENLEWVTSSENTIHAIKNNLIRFGEKSYNNLLTEQKVLLIRRLFRINPNFSRKNVAKKFNVSEGCIYGVIRNVTWKHLL